MIRMNCDHLLIIICCFAELSWLPRKTRDRQFRQTVFSESLIRLEIIDHYIWKKVSTAFSRERNPSHEIEGLLSILMKTNLSNVSRWHPRICISFLSIVMTLIISPTGFERRSEKIRESFNASGSFQETLKENTFYLDWNKLSGKLQLNDWRKLPSSHRIIKINRFFTQEPQRIWCHSY